jgi:hypothetical protein
MQSDSPIADESTNFRLFSYGKTTPGLEGYLVRIRKILSSLSYEYVAPTVPLWYPFSSIRQAVKDFLPLPYRCAPYRDRILHTLLPLVHPGRAPIWSISMPSPTHLPVQGTETRTTLILRKDCVLALEQCVRRTRRTSENITVVRRRAQPRPLRQKRPFLTHSSNSKIYAEQSAISVCFGKTFLRGLRRGAASKNIRFC